MGERVTGPVHGHGIAKHIQRTSGDVLLVKHGSLYPALHRRLSPQGRRQLQAKESRWESIVRAAGRVMKPA